MIVRDPQWLHLHTLLDIYKIHARNDFLLTSTIENADIFMFNHVLVIRHHGSNEEIEKIYLGHAAEPLATAADMSW